MRRDLDSLRRDAVDAFAAAVSAVQPLTLLPRAVTVAGGRLSVHGEPLPEVRGRRVVAGLGKAAPALVEAWRRTAPGWADELFVLAPHGVAVAPELAAAATVRRGAHPLPDEAGDASTRELLALADGLGGDDLLVVLLSGGASALLAAPVHGLELEDVRSTTRRLLEAGAPITAVNSVRRQLLEAAGGGLAAHAVPARVVTLVLSDVLGDPLADIASGPTVPSPTDAVDALAVLERFAVRQAVPRPVVSFLEGRRESPADHRPRIGGGRTAILANNRTAVEAAASTLRSRGYRVAVAEAPLQGEAATRGHEIARRLPAPVGPEPAAWVAGGETTVTVAGRGRGGRCRELALAAAMTLQRCVDPAVLLAAGTDGVDGTSENAGAVVDPATVPRLRAAGVDPAAALADNDSATALAAAGDILTTGPTGTNACDVILLLAAGTEP